MYSSGLYDKCKEDGVRGLEGDDSVEEGLDAGLSIGENADRGMSGERDVTGGEGIGKRHCGREGRTSCGRGRRRRAGV